MRQGETLGLCWPNLKLEDGPDLGEIRVRQALQRQAGGLVFVPPKCNAGRRTIPLPVPLWRALREHRDQQQHERHLAGRLWGARGPVFTTSIGTPVDPRNHYRAWKQLLARVGVRDARLHDARHTAATLLLAQGVPARVAMQILGHSADHADPRRV